MINFACTGFEIDEVVKCSLGLSKAEYKLFSFFIKHHEEDFSTEELSSRLKLEKSTIQRGVKKLHEKSLLFRSQLNQSVGGYLFKYRIKNKAEIKKNVYEILDKWNDKFKEELKKW